ncbi:unnamed protein product (macronuclear) [Paramecium tetraurelia]|uniref:Uncharacterized protein n=1 Tax=Paramecium tetraurelia TaxID=5888 RepID=A0C0V0_PARTE|nr:uncharacterized protein GSPATT00033893001 [Paramecium tetraurelia]CAK64417.1 unnamed protein product [Paramecium tetraurelia]|eukprot:XP_001431815.1 hypothetical protein (macronuclear) [Paramecium tetraurelia strain d4-2]
MKSREDSVSIRSDEQSLDLDCRIMKPKFKQQDYDTYQTEITTSVYKRIMEIQSSSSEYKFKACHETIFSTNKSHCKRKSSDFQFQESNEEQLKNEKYVIQNCNNLLGQEKKRKKKCKKGSLYSVKSQSQSPIQNQNQQIQLLETQSKKSQRSVYKSSTVNKSKKGMSNSQDRQYGYSLDYQPIRIQQRTNHFLTNQFDQFKDPIQEKLSLNQLNMHLLNENKLGSMYRNNNNCLLNASQPKSILKSKSVCSESSNGENSSRYKSMKSSIFKKVTFESIKGQNNMKQSLRNQQQIIIIQ